MAYSVKQECPTLPELGFRFCIIGDDLKHNEDFINAIEHFNLPLQYCSNELEFANQGTDFTTIYILNEFEGNLFTKLHKAGQRILGPTIVMQYAKKKESLPNNIRPLYTTSMRNLVISFSGFRVKEELHAMVAKVHHLGGSVRKDFNMSKTTHLVATPDANKTSEKYRYAVTLGIPVMTAEWIYEVWSRRHDVICRATDADLMQFRMLPFVGCRLAFLGYKKEDEQHMIEVTLKNGGKIVSSEDQTCTHLIVDDEYTVNTELYNPDTHIVKNEWFWACIQMEAKAEERVYIYEMQQPTITTSSSVQPTRGNKRKRLASVAQQIIIESFKENDIFCPDIKKKSDIALSLNTSFLDATCSPDKTLDTSDSDHEMDSKMKSPLADFKSFTPRQKVCLELFQTERNYVDILHTIITVFKQPLEDPNQIGEPLLAPTEVKIIFGKLPKIYALHQNVKNELSTIIHCWSNDHSIGNVFYEHADDFRTSYLPFINFFEKAKSLLSICDATKPRFHAFLKRCQSKSECGRQTLQELLIRPVQRLPSVILLLTDILKHTPKNYADHNALEKAIEKLKDVLKDINEGKRETEGQVKMFDVVNDIHNCPAHLLSSHRNLVTKVDTHETTELLNKKGGTTTTLFLFTDVLEICKKRLKAAANNLRSPGVVSLSSARAHIKSYKHLELISLSHIKKVVDVVEREECKNTFAIVLWSSKELKELIYVFVLFDEIDKKSFLQTLCRQVANSVCKADAEKMLTSLEPEQLDLFGSENSGNALIKALGKTKCKLGRALSMKKSPNTKKHSLSRAVSTFMSPLRNFGAPGNSMSSLRLSSVTNLTELVPTSPSLAPSPVSGKKIKAHSLGIHLGKFNFRH